MPKKAPKSWWDAKEKEVKESNPEYTDAQTRGTVGKIWWENMSEADRQKVLKKKEGKTSLPKGSVFLSKEAAQFKGLFSPKYEKYFVTEVSLLAANNWAFASVEEANANIDKAIKELTKIVQQSIEPEITRLIADEREDILTDLTENVVAGPNLPQMGPSTPAPAPTTEAVPVTAPAVEKEPETISPPPASKLSKVIKALSANASLTLNEAPEDIHKMKANIDVMLEKAGIKQFEAALDNGQYKFTFEDEYEAKLAHDVLDSEGFNVMLNESGEAGINREQKAEEEEQLLDEAPQRRGKQAQDGSFSATDPILIDLEGRAEVYDNGGKTADRYTVIIDGHSVFTMSERPSHPQGVSQYAGEMNEMRGDILELSGTPVPLNELPEEVIKGIKQRVWDIHEEDPMYEPEKIGAKKASITKKLAEAFEESERKGDNFDADLTQTEKAIDDAMKADLEEPEAHIEPRKADKFDSDLAETKKNIDKVLSENEDALDQPKPDIQPRKAALELRPVGSNMTEVETDTVVVLFSYSTPVAYMDKASGQCFRTVEKFSTTTSRHINKWLEGRPAEEVDQAQIEGLVQTASADTCSIEAIEEMDKGETESILSKIVGEAVDLGDFKEVLLEEQELEAELETKDDMSQHTQVRLKEAQQELPDLEATEITFEKYGPGKYDSNLDAWLDSITLEGMAMDELGDAENFGHYSLVLFETPVTVHEDAQSWQLGGALVGTNSQGFVNTDTFDTAEQARTVWESLQEDYAQFLGEHGEEGEEDVFRGS